MAAYGMILRKSWSVSAVGALLLFAFAVPMQATLIACHQLEAKLGLVNTLTVVSL